jgi:hypothetical protein
MARSMAYLGTRAVAAERAQLHHAPARTSARGSVIGQVMMDQRIVLIIGGSSGIGHEVARQSSAQGARLIIVGRNQAKLTAAAERISQAIGKTVRYVNLTLEEKRRALVAAGIPPERVDALNELFSERRKCSDARFTLRDQQDIDAPHRGPSHTQHR